MLTNASFARKQEPGLMVMGDLPEDLPHHLSSLPLTYLGPQVRDGVKKRVTMKVWGVVFCCMSKRAFYGETGKEMVSNTLKGLPVIRDCLPLWS